MKLTFDETPKQLELIRAMGSKNKVTAETAQNAFAALLSPILGQVLQQADTTKQFYRDFPYDEGTNPSYTAELFLNVDKEHFAVWSAGMPGGLATNTFFLPHDEVKFTTYRLDSAWSILIKYAREGSLQVVSRALERLMQEVLLKTNHMAWSVMLAALAQASHSYLGVSMGHVTRAAATGVLTLEDQSALLTRFRRLNSSWTDGTPVGGGGSPTDMYLSPQMMQYLRSLSYNPINIKGANNTTGTANSGIVTLPEAQRAALWNSGGVPEFYGIAIHELLELDKGNAYSVLFDTYIGSLDIPLVDGTASGTVFDSATNEVMLVIDSSRDLGLRALEKSAENGSTFTLEPDDQFLKRSKKLGWFGGLEEGRHVTDTYGLHAMVL